MPMVMLADGVMTAEKDAGCRYSFFLVLLVPSEGRTLVGVRVWMTVWWVWMGASR